VEVVHHGVKGIVVPLLPVAPPGWPPAPPPPPGLPGPPGPPEPAVHRDLAELPASPASRDNLVNPADSGGASKPIQASGMAFDRSPPAHHPGITTKVLRTKDIHKQNHRL